MGVKDFHSLWGTWWKKRDLLTKGFLYSCLFFVCFSPLDIEASLSNFMRGNFPWDITLMAHLLGCWVACYFMMKYDSGHRAWNDHLFDFSRISVKFLTLDHLDLWSREKNKGSPSNSCNNFQCQELWNKQFRVRANMFLLCFVVRICDFVIHLICDP